MNVLDLFSGIGGFSLGLERAGMRTVAFCEIDPYCRRVLARHWPTVPVYEDVRTLTAARLMADAQRNRRDYQPLAGTPLPPTSGAESEEPQPWRTTDAIANGRIDVICGGFPCQDISHAGKGAGIGGARSGLWGEFARIIGEVRPQYAIVENVAALLGRGLERVLGDLAALGYDAEWHCIRAADVGAPHLRDRIWIIAHPQHPDANRAGSHRADQYEHGGAELRDEQEREPGSLGAALAYADRPRLEGWLRASLRECAEQRFAWAGGSSLADAGWIEAERHERDLRATSQRDWWRTEPDVGRVAHGVPARVDRLRSLGNAIVPQIPEIIGRAIMTYEAHP